MRMSTQVDLPAELTIYTVGEWHPRFMAWLSAKEAPLHGDGVMHLHAHEVSEIDAAGVQLLVSVNRFLAAQNKRLALIDASPKLMDACKALGASCLVEPIPEGARHGQ
jgi:ABC-type transporter Mla MlaB component